jgi:hypothetical protein
MHEQLVLIDSSRANVIHERNEYRRLDNWLCDAFMVTDHNALPQSQSVMHTSERVENEDDRVPSRMSSASMTHRDISR